MRYTEGKENIWIYPTRKDKFARCDCGLVHKMDFRYSKRSISFRKVKLMNKILQIDKKPDISSELLLSPYGENGQN